MPDWGGIGAGNAAAGFLSGFAQSYARANQEKTSRANAQKDAAFNMFATAALKDPTLTTNGAWYNAINAEGVLDPEQAQVLSGFGQLQASQPHTQRLAHEQETLDTMRQSIFGDPSEAQRNPYAAAAAVPEAKDILAQEASVANAKPQIIKMAGGTPDAPTSITAQVSRDADGNTVVTPLGEGPAKAGVQVNVNKGPASPSAAERKDIAGTEAAIDIIGRIEQRLPALKKIAGPIAGRASRLSARAMGGRGLSDDQLIGLQDIAELRNELYHLRSGAAVFANEESRLIDEAPTENMGGRQLELALKRTRANYIALQQKRQQVLQGSGVRNIPGMTTSEPGAAEAAPPPTTPAAPVGAPAYDFGDGMTVQILPKR